MSQTVTAPTFTPTQTRIMAVLADGQPHTRAQLRGCVDEQADNSTLNQHLTQIRKVLRPRGQDVWCVLHRRTLCYRLAGLLAPA